MKKYLKRYGLALLLFACAGLVPRQLLAQAACSSSGETVGPAAEFGNSAYAIGDLTVVSGGANPTDVNDADWYLAAGANVDVYAAVTIPTGTVVRLKAGAVLNVYGNFTNNGFLFVEPGATINFYGNTWTNGTGATVGDGIAAANTAPGGAINFIAPRPAIPAGVSASACIMSNYSGGNFVQNIDGGNVPMDIALHVQNANNIKLINSNTKIEGSVVFDVNDGDVDLGNNNFTFTANGNWSSNVAPNAAYFLTNGTTACAGAVEKLGLAPGATFTFPIGRAETYSGGRDYTPAMIRNDGTVIDDFQVRVKNYADAISIGGVIINAPQEGIDRAWQITSTHGSGVSMSLQHNSATNGTTYQGVFGGDPTAFITQYQGAGVWDVGTTPTEITGTVSGSVVHTRGFSVTTTATSCTDPKSWFTKSNDPLTPLPITLVSFAGKVVNCNPVLNWVSAEETNAGHYELQRTLNGSIYTTIGSLPAKGSNSSYNYTDGTAPQGSIQYRLRMTDKNGKEAYSNIVAITLNCGGNIVISVYPNPVKDRVTISGLGSNSRVRLLNAIGQVLTTVIPTGSTQQINMSSLPKAVYLLQVIQGDKLVKSVKLMKE